MVHLRRLSPNNIGNKIRNISNNISNKMNVRYKLYPFTRGTPLDFSSFGYL